MRDIYRCGVCGKYIEEKYHCGTQAELVMSSKQRESLSKLISYLLRHSPHEACLELSNNGWIKIKELVNGIKTMWRNKHLYSWVRENHIYAIAILDPKNRFEIQGDMIRAKYGHSKNDTYSNNISRR